MQLKKTPIIVKQKKKRKEKCVAKKCQFFELSC